MIVIAWCVVFALGVFLTFLGNKHLSIANEGYRIPLLYGKFVVRPSAKVKAERLVGFVLIYLGLAGLAGCFWHPDTFKLVTWTTIAAFVLAVGVPPLVVTVAHNRRNSPAAT